MNRNQWHLVQTMCAFEPQERVPIGYVVEQLKQFAEAERERSSTLGNAPSTTRSTSVLANLHGFVVPELSSTIENVLKNLQARCPQVVDARDTVLHVHARLASIFETLHDMQMLPREVEVMKFCDVLISFGSFLRTAVSATSVTQRAKSRKASLKDNVLHREIDGLLDLLQVANINPVHIWRRETATNAPTDISLQCTIDEEKTEKVEGVVKFLHFKSNKFNRKFDAIGTKTAQDSAQESTHPPWHIPIHELKYAIENCIGVGAFGAVYLGTWLGTSAANFMGYEDDNNAGNEQMSFHELRVWYPLNHPHVVKLCGACRYGKRFFVCEYAGSGTLRDYLQRGENQGKTRKKLYEIALGLQYLLEQSIVHNDLKGDNFLVDSDDKAKTTDFGLSCIPRSAEVKIDPKQQGAQQWESPECLRGERSVLASDVYSFGMRILEVVTGTSPWGSVLDVMVRAKIRKGLLPARPKSASRNQWTLVEMMCASDPLRRLSIGSAVGRLDEFLRIEGKQAKQVEEKASKRVKANRRRAEKD